MKIEIFSLALIFFAVAISVWGFLKIHLYPGKVAEARNHPQKQAIDVTALLGLIIFPFWMVALMWAYSGAVFGKLYAPGSDSAKDEKSPAPTPESSPTQPTDQPSDSAGIKQD